MATSDLLVYGQYRIKEESEGKYSQLNTNEYIKAIYDHRENESGIITTEF